MPPDELRSVVEGVLYQHLNPQTDSEQVRLDEMIDSITTGLRANRVEGLLVNLERVVADQFALIEEQRLEIDRLRKVAYFTIPIPKRLRGYARRRPKTDA